MPPRLLPCSLYAVKPLKSFGLLPSTSPSLRTLPRRPVVPKTLVRPASQRRQWGPRRTQYNRFRNVPAIYYLLNRYSVGALGALGSIVIGFYYYNLEEVPVSGRRRFNYVSPAWEERLANSEYQMIMRQYGRQILPPDHPYSRLVNKVLKRLIPAAGLEAQNWEVRVIDDPDEKNAFVFPGGKVFVFSGMFPICAREEGVAAVLGHEIAHNIAHHTAEQISHSVLLFLLAAGLTFSFDISAQFAEWLVSIVLRLPRSRKLESEADHIGLLMMAQACYDPDAAVELWEHLAAEIEDAPRSFLSTHPASEDRNTAIQKWLPQARQKWLESKCESTIGFVEEFRKAFVHEDDMKRASGRGDEWFR